MPERSEDENSDEAEFVADLWADVDRPEGNDDDSQRSNESGEALSEGDNGESKSPDGVPEEPANQEESADSPLAELRQRMESRGDQPLTPEVGNEEPDVEEPFDEMDSETLEADDVWAQLEQGSESEPVTTGQSVDTDVSGDVRQIPKRTCHNCRYFGEPPDLHCNHEGTEIREVVGPDTFEVVDCPMVVDDEDL